MAGDVAVESRRRDWLMVGVPAGSLVWSSCLSATLDDACWTGRRLPSLVRQR